MAISVRKNETVKAWAADGHSWCGVASVCAAVVYFLPRDVANGQGSQ